LRIFRTEPASAMGSEEVRIRIVPRPLNDHCQWLTKALDSIGVGVYTGEVASGVVGDDADDGVWLVARFDLAAEDGTARRVCGPIPLYEGLIDNHDRRGPVAIVISEPAAGKKLHASGSGIVTCHSHDRERALLLSWRRGKAGDSQESAVKFMTAAARAPGSASSWAGRSLRYCS
jgi:hypothetical protein